MASSQTYMSNDEAQLHSTTTGTTINIHENEQGGVHTVRTYWDDAR